MKKLTQFVFGKWYGATLAWLAWGAAVLAYCLIAGPYWSLGSLTTAVIVSHLLGAVGLLCVVVHSLLKRRWRRVIAQLLLWVLAVVSYGAGLRAVAVAVISSERYMNDFDRTQEPWYGTKPCETVPFGVEFRHGHPYLAEYDRRVVFKSGKSVLLDFDTGGAGDFAVSALADGKFGLMDGLENIQHRHRYVVDIKAETVNPVPSARSPAGNEDKDKRYLGRITTRGELDLGGNCP